MPVDHAGVRARYASGESIKDIAESYGVGERYIRKIINPAASSPTLPVASLQFILALVATLMQRVGPNYGYSVMEGMMIAETGGAYHFPKRRVLHALQTLAPVAYASRRHWSTLKLPRGCAAARLTPPPAHAAALTPPLPPPHRSYEGNHFMYSVHMDLTCKLQELGIYVGLIIDGDSRKVLALVALPNKLAATVFERLFLPFLMAYGFPDQLITDKGLARYLRADPGRSFFRSEAADSV